MNNRTNPEEGATDEPATTQRNSRTVRAEEQIVDPPLDLEDDPEETSTRTKIGAIPTSYGAAGSTTDATEEGGDGTGI